MAHRRIISVSLTPQELSIINEYCEKEGCLRSRFLVRNAVKYIKEKPLTGNVIGRLFGR